MPNSLVRTALIISLAVMSAVLLGGCTASRNDLGTTNGTCYVAIPQASGAVHDHGRLLGARLDSLKALKTFAPKLSEAVLAHDKTLNSRVCLVAFGGNFRRASVTSGIGYTTGSIAVVVLEYPSSKVIATFISKRSIASFSHTHFG